MALYYEYLCWRYLNSNHQLDFNICVLGFIKIILNILPSLFFLNSQGLISFPMCHGDASWSDGVIMENWRIIYIFLFGCSQNYRFAYPRPKEEYLKQECPKIVQSRQNSIFDHGHYFTSSSNLVQHRDHDQRSLSRSLRSNHPSLDRTSRRLQREVVVGMKRKAGSNCELDLNLSLGLESRNDVQRSDENFSLSSNGSSSSNSMLIYKKLKEGTSTLDLTLWI